MAGASPPAPTLLKAILGPELRSLEQEAGRRNQAVTEACRRATAKLAALPANACGAEDEFLRQAEELWQPLISGCDCKQPRPVAVAVGALAKLLSHGLVRQGAVGDVVGALSRLREFGDEQVRLKVLQCLACFFSSSARGTYELPPAQLASVLSLALPAQRGAYLVVKELCLIASGEGGQCARAPSDASRALSLDLLHALVTAYSQTMARIPQFVHLVNEDLSLLLAEQLKAAAAGGRGQQLRGRGKTRGGVRRGEQRDEGPGTLGTM
eukprot:gene46629-57415_t